MQITEIYKTNKMKEIIYIGIIEHRHGTNVYASKTQQGLNKQLAQYCTDNWNDHLNSIKMPENNAAITEMYFDEVTESGEEILLTFETELL